MFRNLFRTNDTPQPQTGKRAAIEELSPAALKARLEGEDPILLLDVRMPGEFSYDGHIKGSRLLPLPQVTGRSEELPRDMPIVCICRSGNRSRVACEMLRQQGFTQLCNLTGGVIGWSRQGLPLS